jgi:hypothetical protein
VDKCIGCHFYDRQHNGPTESRGQWGQCRRSAPRLHPVNQKSFMIEGVWPHVRDDDWCGEWKAAAVRRVEPSRVSDSKAPGPLLPVGSGAPMGPRPVVSSIQSSVATPMSASSIGSLMSSGRSD